MLIGLTGAAGAGKDTVCEMIQDWGEHAGLSVRREAFVDRMKLSAARIFFPDIELGPAVAWCNGLKGPGNHIVALTPHDGAPSVSGREFLQRYGTESHRDVFGTDFWVEAALQDLSAEFTVVTDVRFNNEAVAIHDRGGVLWRIVRPDQGHIAESGHVSEAGIRDRLIDGVVRNASTVAELRKSVHLRMIDLVVLRPTLAA